MSEGRGTLLSRVGRLTRRTMARHCARREAHLPKGFAPTVSFTFDDFPESAAEYALPSLDAAGMRATWYVSSGLLGQPSPLGPIATEATLAALHASGHEIGNHTLGHLDARAARPGEFGRDIDENERALVERLPGVRIRSFSYPFGQVTVSAKRAAMARAMTCRSTISGIARGTLDLALLPANPLYEGLDPVAKARDLIARLRQAGGWAIFYTHDVAPSPSPWGCTPSSFAAVVAAVSEAGLRVATVGSVAEQISIRSTPAAGRDRAVRLPAVRQDRASLALDPRP